MVGLSNYGPDAGYSRPAEGRRRHRGRGDAALRNMRTQVRENYGGGMLMDIGGRDGVVNDWYAEDVDPFGYGAMAGLDGYGEYMGFGRY